MFGCSFMLRQSTIFIMHDKSTIGSRFKKLYKCCFVGVFAKAIFPAWLHDCRGRKSERNLLCVKLMMFLYCSADNEQCYQNVLLQVTPGLGVITMILLMVVIPNPKRGALEASTAIAIDEIDRNRSSHIQDLTYVFKKYASIKPRTRLVVSGQCAQAHDIRALCALARWNTIVCFIM